MKRYLMATAMVALSVASAANAQDSNRYGTGNRPGQGVREQQRHQEAQQQQQQARPQQDRGDRGGDRGGGRGWDRGDRGDRGQNVQPQPQAQPQPATDRGDRRQWEGRDRGDRGGDRQQFRDGRDGRPDVRGDNRRWEDPRPGPRARDDRRDDRGRYDRGWRGGDRNDYRQWRGNDRRGRAWPSQQRFRIGVYSAPYGYSYRRWSFGEYLPRAYYAQQYVLRDFWNYDLPEPPYGTYWVRYGSDALLVDARSGYVEDVIYGIFW